MAVTETYRCGVCKELQHDTVSRGTGICEECTQEEINNLGGMLSATKLSDESKLRAIGKRILELAPKEEGV